MSVATSLFSHPEYRGHERVMLAHDPETGLQALIGGHSTARGPALGGGRVRSYESEDAALTDVLRLSRGMTFKNAVANLPLGGGKTVVMASKDRPKTTAMMAALGRAIEDLSGKYLTAEDVGTSPADMTAIASGTSHVAGLSPAEGGMGDPSPSTALGVFLGLKAAVKHRLQREDLTGLTVAVQGLGHVGFGLAKHLHEAGARLVVADINQAALDKAAAEFGAKIVGTGDIYGVDCDVFAPCALGAVINAETRKVLQARVIAGAANNQLATDADGDALDQAGILYAPDYVINAGGVIQIWGDYYKVSRSEIETRVGGIGHTLAEIFERAEREGTTTAKAADALAHQRVEEAANGAAARIAAE